MSRAMSTRLWFVLVLVAACGGSNSGLPDAPGGPGADARATADGPGGDDDAATGGPDAAGGGPDAAGGNPDAAGGGPDASTGGTMVCPTVTDVIDVPTVATASYDELARLVHAPTGNAIIWTQQTGPSDFEVMFSWVDAAMHRLPGSHAISPDDGFLSGFARIVWNGTEFGVVYSDDRLTTPDRGVYFARLDATGAVIAGSEVKLGGAAGSQDYAAVAWNPVDHQWGVAWLNLPGGDADVRFARLDATGAAIAGSQIEVTTASGFAWGYLSDSGTSPLIWTGTQYALAWTTQNTVAITEIPATGGAIHTIAIPVTGAQMPDRATIAWDGTHYGITWMNWASSHYRVHSALVDATGIVAGTDVALGDATLYSGESSIVWTGADYALAWHEEGGTPVDGSVWTARVDATGAVEPGTKRQLTCGPAFEWFPTIFTDGATLAIVYDDWDSSIPDSESHVLLFTSAE